MAINTITGTTKTINPELPLQGSLFYPFAQLLHNQFCTFKAYYQ